ncbi:MAG: hypothetical protein EOO09_09410 [Chitinophagaceae bacterium]|nr:MAG: hypothetical protein EOO09_09410 [Chitinophagaceae bacterium]
MKKIPLVLMILLSGVIANAQDEGGGGFEKERLFTGGSVTLSFFNGQTLLGANPMLGYTLADWVDAGIAFNFLYNGARDYLQYNDKIRQTVYGPGVFTRLYPVKFLFVQGQLEHNFTTLKYIPAPGGSYPSDRIKTGTNSLLLGAGLAQGRQPGSNTFFYISLLFDVLKNMNSPYVNVTVNPNNTSQQRIDMVPIIRAGASIGLFQGKNRR